MILWAVKISIFSYPLLKLTGTWGEHKFIKIAYPRNHVIYNLDATDSIRDQKASIIKRGRVKVTLSHVNHTATTFTLNPSK